MFEFYGYFTDADFGRSTVKKYYGVTEDTYDEEIFTSHSESYISYPVRRLNEMFCRVGKYAR